MRVLPSGQVVKNHAGGVLAVALGTSDLSAQLMPGHTWPALSVGQWAWGTMATDGFETRWEDVKVTAIAMNALTITRAQQGSAAQDWPIGSKLQLRVTEEDVALPGPTGPQGPKGDTGAQGPAGTATNNTTLIAGTDPGGSEVLRAGGGIRGEYLQTNAYITSVGWSTPNQVAAIYNPSGAMTGGINAFRALILTTRSAAGGALTAMVGEVRTSTGVTGTYPSAVAVQASINSAVAGAAITTAYGVYVTQPQSTGGISNYYGLYIANPAPAGVTSGYAIWTEGRVRLGGALEVDAGHIKPPQYTVATLPAGSNGLVVYATNGRKAGETAGNGTGCLVVYSGGQWRRLSDETQVLA